MPDLRLICEDCSTTWFLDERHESVEPDIDAMSCQVCGGRLRRLLDELLPPRPAPECGE
jgi:hypothetical protein